MFSHTSASQIETLVTSSFQAEFLTRSEDDFQNGLPSFSKRVWFSKKKKGGEVGSRVPITTKEAQPYSVTRTFSTTEVPLGKKACDKAAPTSPAAKEAAETGTLERPGESAQVSYLDTPCVEVLQIADGSGNQE